MLVLGGCAGLCTALKAFIDFARELPFRLVRQVAWWSSGAAIAMLIAIAGNLGFKILGISILAEDPSTRYGMYWQESRPACEYIAEHFRPGDFVAGNYNYSYHYFTENGWISPSTSTWTSWRSTRRTTGVTAITRTSMSACAAS